MKNGELGTFYYSYIQVYLCTTNLKAINIFQKKNQDDARSNKHKSVRLIYNPM